ncbi:BlaI/MecI/CopY family transcriptional regulator [Lujinxingia vulgaris]|nr:BlaI/MecI/CopY family transcriptional regulator [Lujinxingia vulgaris]
MAHELRMPHLALGDLEQAVLDVLWREGALNPGQMHQVLGEERGISVNTVSSAMKRLFDKGLLEREKVSHAYEYRAAVSRAELQRQLIASIAERFSGEERAGLLAAFVDIAQADGEETLRRLEALVNARLKGGE